MRNFIVLVLLISVFASCSKEPIQEMGPHYSEVGRWKILPPNNGVLMGDINFKNDSVYVVRQNFGLIKGRYYRNENSIMGYHGDSVVFDANIIKLGADTLNISVRRTVAYDNYITVRK